MSIRFVSNKNPLLQYLHFTEAKVSAKIFPNLGASLQEWSVGGVEIIEDITTSENILEAYRSKFLSSLLFPFPNRLNKGSYIFDNKKYQFPINFPDQESAIHGYIYDKPFKILTQTNNIVVLQYTIKDQSIYPSEVELQVSYAFNKDCLDMAFEIKNIGSQTIPYGIGWHPYFSLRNSYHNRLHFSAETVYETDNRSIPFKAKPYSGSILNLDAQNLDTAFKLNSRHLRLETDQYQLEFTLPETSYLQVFTPENEPWVAIEPMTCIANSFNNKIGLRTLKPNETYQWAIALKISV